MFTSALLGYQNLTGILVQRTLFTTSVLASRNVADIIIKVVVITSYDIKETIYNVANIHSSRNR